VKVKKLLLILVLAIALVFAFGAIALAATDSPVGANHNPLPTFTSTWDKDGLGPLGLFQKATNEDLRDGLYGPDITNQGELTNWWKADSGFKR
jgi:hypothetical protein